MDTNVLIKLNEELVTNVEPTLRGFGMKDQIIINQIKEYAKNFAYYCHPICIGPYSGMGPHNGKSGKDVYEEDRENHEKEINSLLPLSLKALSNLDYKNKNIIFSVAPRMEVDGELRMVNHIEYRRELSEDIIKTRQELIYQIVADINNNKNNNILIFKLIERIFILKENDKFVLELISRYVSW